MGRDGDADGDGCTQFQEFTAFGVTKGANPEDAYIQAALDFNISPASCTIHDADTTGDGVIGLSELLRVIQFYNAGEYSCALDSTEDGYTVGESGIEFGTSECAAHDVDFLGIEGNISLSELLRMIQFFNLGGLLVESGSSEDGWTVQVGI